MTLTPGNFLVNKKIRAFHPGFGSLLFSRPWIKMFKFPLIF